jgi:serine phosphatase RsbU (regulator of sigma subunit)
MLGAFSFFSLVFVILVASEMLRIAHRAYRARRPGSVLIGCGLLVFYVCQFVGPFSAALFDELWGVWLFPAGMTAFVVAASLHLAREFVSTNRALRQAHEKISASQKRLANDIQEASDYVRSLLPAPLSLGPIQTAWVFQPSSELGGDAFGHHWLDEDRFVVYLLDVCGHGVGSALLSVSVMNALRARNLPGIDFADPAAVLNGLNQAFPMDANRGQYFTMWYGVFDRRNRSLRYGSGGHPPAYLLSGQTPFVALRTHGPPIGFLPEAQFVSAEHTVPPSSVLHLISDGVYELIGPQERVATLTDFERELEIHRWTHPSHLLARAMDRTRFLPLDDDLSALTITLP